MILSHAPMPIRVRVDIIATAEELWMYRPPLATGFLSNAVLTSFQASYQPFGGTGGIRTCDVMTALLRPLAYRPIYLVSLIGFEPIKLRV